MKSCGILKVKNALVSLRTSWSTKFAVKLFCSNSGEFRTEYISCVKTKYTEFLHGGFFLRLKFSRVSRPRHCASLMEKIYAKTQMPLLRFTFVLFLFIYIRIYWFTLTLSNDWVGSVGKDSRNNKQSAMKRKVYKIVFVYFALAKGRTVRGSNPCRD